MTGFTLEGKIELDVTEQIQKDNLIPAPEAVVKVGAKYSSPLRPYDDYSITDGRIASGANPASGRSTAERAAKLFEQFSGKEAEGFELVGLASR